jgi:hypothetical protein
MEYLLVHFERSRRVVIDDEFNGRTEQVIEIDAGRHEISLGPPHNFTPTSQIVILRDTTSLEPREVTFELETAC